MADQKITQLVDGGAPQATDEFVIARAGDNFKVDYASLESAGLAGAVILAPAASARNVIQPTAGAVIAAIVKAHAAQSVDLTQWQLSDGTVVASFSELGALSIQTGPGATGLLLSVLESTGSFGMDLTVDGRMSVFTDPALVNGSTFRSFGGPLGNAGVNFVSVVGGVLDSLLIVLDDTGAQVLKLGSAGEFGIFGQAPTPAAQQTAATIGDLWTALKAYGWLDAGSVAPSAGGAPTTATYITQTPDAGLSAEQALSALATGLVKNTTGTGVLSIGAQGTDYYAPGGTDVAVADGGTGASTAAGARTALDVPSNAEAILDTFMAAKGDLITATANDTPAILTAGANGLVLAADSAEASGLRWAPGGATAIGARRRYSYYNDFSTATIPGGGAFDGFIGQGNSGAGAGLTVVAIADASVVGVVRASTGTASTGRQYLGTHTDAIALGQGKVVFEARINVAILSDGTDTYSITCGFSDGVSASPVDAVAFRYDSAGVGTNSAASLNWQTLTAANSSRTYVTTATAVAAATWVTLRIEVNAAASTADFYINGVSTGTQHVATIPSGVTRILGYGFLLLKSAALNARTVDLDYIACDIDFTTPRPG